ncbi:Na+/H+ antiporter NhaC family protein [Carboxylicivirga sediminis]|uniref:Na+/H+ antiporter NhaC family protein n=1 Tax=Carboxylicivirga sediminis TaxID=2006564 RepID=A0A941IXY4_9BACT|nr:Na+/H+ antiporter NhaC family protein [Carboxylicivirga sediminis]MBR8537331.1 Na+/H+ antiporter NhaC family protein [Carboxylicivirga sediminis]
MKTKQSLALLPIIVFLFVYLIPGWISGDFYKLPILIPFIIASVIAIVMAPGQKTVQKIDVFTKGMGQSGIMLMCGIFILAGAFANVAKEIGAVDATVDIGLHFLPQEILLAGLFIIGCFISLAVGTSVGTVVALTPVAIGLAEAIEVNAAIAVGAAIGGAMFGDNLSMISDTTIAAARTQNCSMKDKFKANIKLVLPAALISITAYILIPSSDAQHTATITWIDYLKVTPYLAVLIAAIMGMNVFLVLSIGILLAGGIGMAIGDYNAWSFFSSASDGMLGMAEIVLVSLLVGGIVEVVRTNGGIDYIISHIGKRTKSTKGAEFSITLLTGVVNIFTANNTIAILMAGPLVKKIADKFNIKGKRSASLMDTASCFVQGSLPYGAQILAAVGLAAGALSPFDIMGYLFYPYLMGATVLISILIKKPARD